MFFAGAVSIVAFTGLRFRGATRHHGYLFMLLIAAFWIAAVTPERNRRTASERMRKAFLATILAVNAVAGLVAAAAGLIYPFSATWAVAQFIKSTFGDSAVIAAVRDYPAAPIAQWLDRPIYFPETGTYAPFSTQNDRLRTHPSQNEILRQLHEQSTATGKNVLLLVNDRLPQISLIPIGEEHRYDVVGGQTQRPTVLGIKCVAVFDKSVVEDESHRVYLVRPINW
jgi:hypothetical protein